MFLFPLSGELYIHLNLDHQLLTVFFCVSLLMENVEESTQEKSESRVMASRGRSYDDGQSLAWEEVVYALQSHETQENKCPLSISSLFF